MYESLWLDEWENTELRAIIRKYRLIFENISDNKYYSWAKEDVKKYWDVFEFWIEYTWLSAEEFIKLWNKLKTKRVIPEEKFYDKMKMNILKNTNLDYKAKIVNILDLKNNK